MARFRGWTCVAGMLAGLGLLAVTPPAAAGGSVDGWRDLRRGLPLVTAFDVPPTRHNGEVWAFAPADNGRMWIGSDELSLFDGKTRERVELPFGTYAVRGLAHDEGGRLWVGAIGEIGYLKQSAAGDWHYVSARADLQAAGITDLRDVWLAHRTTGGVAFVGDQQVLRWNGTRFERWPLPSSPNLLANEDRDDLWITQSGVGLLKVEREGPRVVVPAAELPSPVVFWALTPGAVGHGTNTPLLIGANDGMYLGRAGQWRKLPAASKWLADKLPLHATMLDDHTFAVGCYLGGLLIASTDDQILAVMDRASGLPHETITGLWFDGENALWAGYPGGMVRIEARGAVSVFDARNGLSEPALKVLTYQEQLYLLSRRMLARVEPGHDGRAATIERVAPLQAPLSDATVDGGELWISGYGGGLWRMAARHEPLPLGSAPGYIFQLLPSSAPVGDLFVLRNTGIEAMPVAAPTSAPSHPASVDFGSYPLNMIRDEAGDIWVSTVTNGLFRFRYDARDGEAQALRLVKHFRPGEGLSHALERPLLTKIGTHVFAYSEREILEYDTASNAFTAVPELGTFAALAATTTTDPAVAYWVVRRSNLGANGPGAVVLLRINAEKDGVSWTPLDVAGLDQIGRISALGFTGDAGGQLWVSGSQSLLRIALSEIKPALTPPSITLRRVECNDLPVALPHGPDPIQLGSDTTRLQMEVAGALRANENPLFVQASLSGLATEWMKPQSEPVFAFTALRPGDYTFRVRAVDGFGRTGPTLALSFHLAAPWYQRGPAIGAYILAGIGLVFAGVRWRLRHLQHQTERLSELVDERTRELAHSNMVKNEFLENISHEIRNPLNGIANLVDLLRDAPLPPEERRLAQSLGRSTEHLKRVFADVLGYTRLEYGHVRVELVPFSLVQLLEDVIALFGIEAREKKTPISLNLPAGFADGFRGDAEKIRAIVTNYVGNALKYASGAPVEIEVRTARQDGSQRHQVWIGVKDHGPGLSAEDQTVLFQKFARGTRAKASGVSGTGLGLATCRGLAELLDGTAGVQSEEGHGAVFWVDLPLDRAELPPTPSTTDVARLNSANNLGGRALIVDDQEYNQAVLRGIARRLGFVADVASHDREVWPLIESRAYSTVFLDWELPGLNGAAIARRLRVHSNTRDAIIIATTAHDEDDIRQECLEAQMDGYALKPFDTAKVQSILQTAAARRAGRAGAEPSLRATAPAADDTQLTLDAFENFGIGDPERAADAVALYLKTLDSELDALRAAADENDRDAVARCAHRVKSHASIVNGVAVSTAAQRVVAAARHPTEPAWRKHLPEVFEQAAALKTAVISLQQARNAAG